MPLINDNQKEDRKDRYAQEHDEYEQAVRDGRHCYRCPECRSEFKVVGVDYEGYDIYACVECGEVQEKY